MNRPDMDQTSGPPDESSSRPEAKKPSIEASPGVGTTPLPKPGGVGSPVSAEQPTLTPAATTPVTPSALEGRPALGRSTFSPNEIVADRYRIVGFLGRGGMGEVYEAEDLELRESVALKTIRPEATEEQRAIERFKREIQLARKVTHPNVCRIFDLGYHRTPTGEEITFLTMELLAGETLAERLRRAGRMRTAEALPLVTQMAAALTAAHQAGIIHRDFKSANVVLVPARPGEEGVRAVVTDFGLARRLAGAESLAAPVSGSGDIIGTPAYMAPEQVKGAEVTGAADLYALGIVMYEMVTGTLPFKGDTPLAAAVKRLEEAPPSPRSRVPDVDPQWEAVILRCLARDPRDRFASAMDVVKALGGEAVTPARGVQRLRLALVGLVGVILLISAVAYHLRVTHKLQQAAPPQVSGLPAIPIKARRSIAVLGFKNLSGRPEAAWLSTALSEMLGTELAAGEKLRTIPGENVAQMKVNLSLAEADSYSKQTLERIRTNLNADLVVLGSYIALGKESGGQIRVDLRLQDALAGETIAATAETGTEAKLFELVSQAGAHLREKLGVGEVSAAEANMVKAALPSNPEAARLYAEGLAKLRLFDALAARDLLEKAVAADPPHALAHSALAAAWSALGYDTKAREEAKKAFDLSANLSREDRLWIEGRYREITHAWEKALEIYRTLFNFFPDNLDYGLRLASVQTSAGKGKDALATVEALRKLPAPARDDPRIDLAEAWAADSLSDLKRSQVAAASAATKGRAQGARLLLASARHTEGVALLDLGQPQKALPAFEEAKGIYAVTGDRAGVSRVLDSIAIALKYQGNLAGATKTFEECLTIDRETGNRRAEASRLNNIANVLTDQGDLRAAKRMLEEAHAIWRELGGKRGMAGTLNNLAGVLSKQGDLAGTKRAYEETLAIWFEVGDEIGVAMALTNLGETLLDQGNLSEAKTDFEKSWAVFREAGQKSYSANSLEGLGEVLLARGELAAARQRHEQALAIRNELGEKLTAAESRLALALLAVEEDRPALAEAPAREVADVFHAENVVEDEATAYAVLTRSLLAQGRVAEAQKAGETATGLLRKMQNPQVSMTVTIAVARVQAALGKPAEAMKSLANVLAQATKLGFVGLQFEARLALGEIEMKSGMAAAGSARLETLEKEAKAKGFGLIARKAAAARK